MHRYLELPHSGSVAAADDHVAWLRSHIGPQVTVLDHRTGSITARLAVPAVTSHLTRRIARVGDGFAANVERYHVLVAGAMVAGRLCGATPRGYVIALHRDGAPVDIVERTPDGTTRVLYTPHDRDATVLVATDEVWIVDSSRLVAVPLGGGAPRQWSLPERAKLVGGGERALVIADEITKSGIRSRVLAPDGDELRELAIVDGEAWPFASAAAAELLAIPLATDDELQDCAVIDLRRGVEVCRLEVPRGTKPVACADTLAIAQSSAVAVLRPDRMQRIAISGAIALTERLLFVAGERLFVVDLDQLAWRDGDVEFAPIAVPPSGDPDPARVVFAGSGLVSVDHPRFGRVTLDRTSPDPALAKGDLIVFDELREEAVGKPTVLAWHKQGEPARTTPREPIVAVAARLPSPGRAKSAVRATQLPALHAVMQRIGREPPALLARLVALHDEDNVARTLLARISLLVEIAELPPRPSWFDPSLVGIAGNGAGDVIALYYYPPDRGELGVVEWMHETQTIEWRAASFDAYMAARLARGDAAAALREQLALAGRASPRVAAPAWFRAAHGARGRVAKRDDLARERSLVRALSSEPSAAAHAELAALYVRLGWSWHSAQLAAMEIER